MGACYSKNTPGPRTSSLSKTLKQKNKNSQENKKLSTEELPSEKTPLKADVKFDVPNTRASRSFSYDPVSDNLYVKHLDHSIAPSDSGIESIGTWHEDTQGTIQIKQLDSDLVEHSEHHNLSFCYKCGHYKPRDTNAVLAGSHILCCQDQTQKPADKSQLLTHDLPDVERTNEAISAVCNPNVSVGISSTAYDDIKGVSFVNNMSPSLVGRDRHLIASSKSVRRSNLALNLSSKVVGGDESKGAFVNGITQLRAPLAQHDFTDRHLNDALDDTVSQQQILLNDNLFIREIFCNCDIDADHHVKNATAAEKIDCTAKSIINDEQREQKDDIINEKYARLSRNGPFEISCEMSSDTKLLPVSEEIGSSCHMSSLTESTSGVYTHNTAPELLLDCKQTAGRLSQQCHGTIISDCSNEYAEGDTEDDMASLDLDNIISQSNGSFRQLNDSSEDFMSLSMSLPPAIDGADCVVIPEETYHEMQIELSILKQQLLCLSSLIQQSEGDDQIIVYVADTSY